MKTIELRNIRPTLKQLLKWARDENVLIIGENGEEFIMAAIDDFAMEVESLRHNDEFIEFLDERAREPKLSIEEARERLLNS